MAAEAVLTKEKSQELESFHYSSNDYIFDMSWAKYRSLNAPQSQFDVKLKAKWDEAMSKGHFRYDLSHLKTRVIPGKQKYILQLNSRRLRERRTPENIVSLQTAFDSKKFNFTQVKSGEIMFLMEPERNQTVSNGFAEEHKIEDKFTDVTHENKRDYHLLIINVSPLEYGHVLLVPDADCGIPQRLTQRGVQMAVEVLLLSSHPGLRVGFNSLCALASVNHQHIHAWYLEHSMVIEDVPVQKISENFYEFEFFPTRGFAFQLHRNTVESFSEAIYKVANYLQTNDIAHNIFMTRGSVFNSLPDQNTSTIRAYIWPRKAFLGNKSSGAEENAPFNVAVAELAGHIPMYVPELFDDMTEEFVCDKISSVMLPGDEFNLIKDNIKRHLSELTINNP